MERFERFVKCVDALIERAFRWSEFMQVAVRMALLMPLVTFLLCWSLLLCLTNEE